MSESTKDADIEVTKKQKDAALMLVDVPWSQLEVIEHPKTGRLLFPDFIARRRKDGTIDKTPIRLCPLRDYEKRKARQDAREWAKSEGLDPEADKEFFDNLDALCRLAIGIRSDSEPYEPFEPEPKRLDRGYDPVTLRALYQKLERYEDEMDPSDRAFDERTVLAVAAAMVTKRSIAPLLAFDGPSQASLLISISALLLNSLQSKSSPESSEPSTPEP
jgi:hypothetical protein